MFTTPNKTGLGEEKGKEGEEEKGKKEDEMYKSEDGDQLVISEAEAVRVVAQPLDLLTSYASSQGASPPIARRNGMPSTEAEVLVLKDRIPCDPEESVVTLRNSSPDASVLKMSTSTEKLMPPSVTLGNFTTGSPPDPSDGSERESNQNGRRQRALKEQRTRRKSPDVAQDDGSEFSSKLPDAPFERTQTPEGEKSNPEDDNRWALMKAEWLRSIPEEFENDWIVVPYPVGKRCSIVASNGETRAHTTHGFFLESFESFLPNGFHRSMDDGSTVLDGIYCENLSSYFVRDALQWEGRDIRDCSCEDRLRYLNSMMSGLETSPTIRCRLKHYVIPLPIFPCTPKGVSAALTWSPLPNLQLELEGILFCHRKSLYVSGTTPLVSWIKPWMVEDVFSNVIIPPSVYRKPHHYKDRRTFMREWDDKEERKRAKGGSQAGRKSI